MRWLNLPLPPDTMPATTQAPAGKHGPWSADFVPLGESIREWTQLVSVQGLPRIAGSGQGRAMLEGMQAARAKCLRRRRLARSSPCRLATRPRGETLKTVPRLPQVPAPTSPAGRGQGHRRAGPDLRDPARLAAARRRCRQRAPTAARPQATADAFIDKVRCATRPPTPAPARRPSPLNKTAATMARLPERIVCLSTETVEALYLLGAGSPHRRHLRLHHPPPRARKEKPKVSGFSSAKVDASWPSSRIWCWRSRICRATSPATSSRPAWRCMSSTTAAWTASWRWSRRWAGWWAGGRALALVADLERTIATARAEGRARAARLGRRPVYFEEWNEPLITGIRWVSELIGIAGGEDCFGGCRSTTRRRRASSPTRRLVIPGRRTSSSDRGAASTSSRPRDQPAGLGRHPAVRDDTSSRIKSATLLAPGVAAIPRGPAVHRRCLDSLLSRPQPSCAARPRPSVGRARRRGFLAPSEPRRLGHQGFDGFRQQRIGEGLQIAEHHRAITGRSGCHQRGW